MGKPSLRKYPVDAPTGEVAVLSKDNRWFGCRACIIRVDQFSAKDQEILADEARLRAYVNRFTYEDEDGMGPTTSNVILKTGVAADRVVAAFPVSTTTAVAIQGYWTPGAISMPSAILANAIHGVAFHVDPRFLAFMGHPESLLAGFCVMGPIVGIKKNSEIVAVCMCRAPLASQVVTHPTLEAAQAKETTTA